MIYVGEKELLSVYIGAKEVSQIYKGSDLIWEKKKLEEIHDPDDIIQFEDPVTKKAIIDKSTIDINGDGEISFGEAAKAIEKNFIIQKSSGVKFNVNKGNNIFADTSSEKFNEFKYFTGITRLDLRGVEDGASIIMSSIFKGVNNLIELSLPPSITKINSGAFPKSIKQICISKLVKEFFPYKEGENPLGMFLLNVNSSSSDTISMLQTIMYDGTKSEWDQIKKYQYWNKGCGQITVRCTNGTIIVPAYSS